MIQRTANEEWLLRQLRAAGVVLSVAWGAHADAQERAAIVVSDNVPVTRGWESLPLIEPHLVAHPGNQRHLLGTMIVSTPAGDWSRAQGCATVLSLDAGRTWTQTPLDVFECGDPWLAIGPDGHAVLTLLGRQTDAPDSTLQLLVFSSSDAGRSWHAVPQRLGVAHDHQKVVADGRGTMHILSTLGRRDAAGRVRFLVYIARRGPTQGQFEVLQRFAPSNLNLTSAGLATLSDGTLVVSFIDFQRPRPPGASPREGLLERPRTWALVLDSAATALGVPLFISESCASGSYLAADTSAGPYRDRLYHVCPDRDGTAILVHQSVDRGESWSAARYIEAPAAHPRTRSHPQLTVNKDGVLGVSWLDSPDDAAGQCYGLYFTASVDGGATFLPTTRVSSRLSCPDSIRNGSAFERWPRGGDYHGLAATADGLFHALWPDAATGVFQTMSATIQVRVGSQ
jgi:hypothetical protein